MAQCSQKIFNSLLLLFGEVLAKDLTLPTSYYIMKTMMKKLTLGYEKIDECENDCMFYYSDDDARQDCQIKYGKV